MKNFLESARTVVLFGEFPFHNILYIDIYDGCYYQLLL